MEQTTGTGRRGLLLVLSSPSGAGKTTLARRLLDVDPEIEMSVSATTRMPRPGEIDGKDYHFVARTAFVGMRDAGEFLEWAEVFGNLYGSPRAAIMARLATGGDVLFDVDWQGARQIKATAANDVVTVFILPPSMAALRERLMRRNQDAQDIVERRMAGAAEEISHWSEYDYVIVNSDADEAFAKLTTILAAERMRRDRQSGLKAHVAELLSE